MAVSAVISRFPFMSVFTRCIGTPIRPFKNNSELIVYSDGMRTCPLTFQRFRLISWWNTKIFQFVRCVQHINFPDGRWNPTCLFRIESVENILRALVDEIDNHIMIYHFNGIRASGISMPASRIPSSGTEGGQVTRTWRLPVRAS
jgi:hypothetical protein